MPREVAEATQMWRTKLQTCIMPNRASVPTNGSSGIGDGRLKVGSGIADDRLKLAAERFYEFRLKLTHLLDVTVAHLQDLKRTSRSRALVLEALGDVSQDSPLSDLTATTSSDEPSSSYASALQARDAATQLEKYDREIVAYVREWEKTVSTRVATELKHIQVLHRTLERYHQKVESLKSTTQKKKQSSQALEDKLAWNESKLRTAKKEYRRNLVAVTLLIEEVTDRGWKDLVPLMIRLIDADIHVMKNAATVLSNLSNVREEMVDLSRRYEMDFEALHTGRLRVLREEDAIDFVDPGDLQDLDSTIASSIDGRGARGSVAVPSSSFLKESGIVKTPNTAPNSDTDDSPRLRRIEEAKQPVVPTEEGVQDESSAVPNYPSSIYLAYPDGGPSAVDDETTLTGVPDMVSV